MSGQLTIALLDRYEDEIRAAIRQVLPDGWTPVFARSPDEHPEILAGADVAWVGASPVTRRLLEAAPQLRLVQKLGAGVDNIDVAAARDRRVAVARLAACNAAQVAEHAVLLMLAVLRRLPEFNRRTREGQWAKELARARSRQLAGRVVGIVGLGAIGREVAARLAGFGTTTSYHDPVRPEPEVEAQLRVTYRELDDLLVTSDVVSLHVPLLPTTHHLLDARRIALMRRGAILVNTARGGVVDEHALAAALASGRLAGAGIDTFACEPPGRSSPLLRADGVVVTPHMAGATADNFPVVLRRAVANTEAFLGHGALPDQDVVWCPGTVDAP